MKAAPGSPSTASKGTPDNPMKQTSVRRENHDRYPECKPRWPTPSPRPSSNQKNAVKHLIVIKVIKHLMTSSCILVSVRVEKSRKLELLCFSSDCFKCGTVSNFEMLITKRRPKLKLENNLNKKMQFSTDFSQNCTKHSSTIALPWQQWRSHGTGLYLK